MMAIILSCIFNIKISYIVLYNTGLERTLITFENRNFVSVCCRIPDNNPMSEPVGCRGVDKDCIVYIIYIIYTRTVDEYLEKCLHPYPTRCVFANRWGNILKSLW